MPRPAARRVSLVLAAVLAAALTVVVRAPAAWLGDYRLSVRGAGNGAQLRLDTLSGPLHLEGSGSLGAAGLRFKGVASAEPQMRPALNGLLGVLGPRSGDNALLSLES